MTSRIDVTEKAVLKLTLNRFDGESQSQMEYYDDYIFTPPQNRGGVTFYIYICVYVCVCVRISCEQNSSRTDVPI